jgi:hypothetical protein
MHHSELYSKEELSIHNPSTPQPRQRDEFTKLQEQVRVLTAQLQRERRASQKTEAEYKELDKKYRAEVVQVQSDVEGMKSHLYKAKLANKTILTDKDRALHDLKAKGAALDELKAQVKSLVTVFVDALETVIRQDDLDSGLQRVQKVLGYKLSTIQACTGADLDLEIQKLNSFSYKGLSKPPSMKSIYTDPDSFCPTEKPVHSFDHEFFTEDSQVEEDFNKYAPLQALNRNISKKAMVFQEPPDDCFKLHKSASRDKVQEGCYAIAEYDFAAEQEGDLNIRKGELIQVLTKDEGGWWYGRIGTRSGNFPSNYVHLV